MSTFWRKFDERLPFTKTERIIIGIVLLLHALPALEFLHWSSNPTRVDDERVMANLVSPDTASSKSQQPPAPPPKPKEEPKKKTVEDLLALAHEGALGVLTVDLDDPTGYGRIVRNAAGDVQRIVEEKDCSASERLIQEGNSGIPLPVDEHDTSIRWCRTQRHCHRLAGMESDS